MEEWQYYKFTVIDHTKDEHDLRDLGTVGWELVSSVVFNGRLVHYLKRPIFKGIERN